MFDIIVFRNQLFKISESFITNQAESLKSFRPIYVGRKTFGDAPVKSTVITLEKNSLIENLRYILFRSVTAFVHQVSQFSNLGLIHSHFGVDGIYALRIAKHFNIPLVTTFHGFDATTTTASLVASGKPAWINYVLYKKELMRDGALFICVSDFIRGKVVGMGFPENKTITHYIGIDLLKTLPRKVKMPYKVILHVARLTEKKGTRYLIEAFSRISQADYEAKLIIIGDGPLMLELKDQVRTLGLGSKVIFLGSKSNAVVMEWMVKTDVFCLPSVTAKSGNAEGLGMVFLEAALAKVPVVATIHGGIPEVVIDGKTGFLVPEKSVDLLSEKLVLLLSDEKLRKQMGLNSRAMVEEKFNLKKQTKKLEELYLSVLK